MMDQACVYMQSTVSVQEMSSPMPSRMYMPEGSLAADEHTPEQVKPEEPEFEPPVSHGGAEEVMSDGASGEGAMLPRDPMLDGAGQDDPMPAASNGTEGGETMPGVLTDDRVDGEGAEMLD